MPCFVISAWAWSCFIYGPNTANLQRTSATSRTTTSITLHTSRTHRVRVILYFRLHLVLCLPLLVIALHRLPREPACSIRWCHVAGAPYQENCVYVPSPEDHVKVDRRLTVQRELISLEPKSLPPISGFPPESSKRLIASSGFVITHILKSCQHVERTVDSEGWIPGWSDPLRRAIKFGTLCQVVVCGASQSS